jgi:hypothetical protein
MDLIDIEPKGSTFHAGNFISQIFPDLPKFLLLIKMTEEDILRFTLTLPDFIVLKRFLYFWITVPSPEDFIFLICQISPVRLLAFRVSERSASRQLIR